MRNNVLKIDRADNVAVLLEDLDMGSMIKVDNKIIKLNEDILLGHKVALVDISKGEEIIKYGFPIGEAFADISRGDWIHSHNMKTSLEGKEEYSYNPDFKVEESKDISIEKKDIPEFMGYRREDGQVGIRNEIWLIPTVGCINKVVERMARVAEEKFNKPIATGKIDGIHAFTHPYGCSQLGEDLLNTQKILAALVKHSNAAGVLVVGLGCENNILEDFQGVIGEYNNDRVKFLKLQDVEDDLECALSRVANLVEYAGQFKREKIPLSELKIGLKCGGSDAFSGITANPLLGKISNRFEEIGGTTILTEVPEMFGAEKILMNRAENKDVFNEIVSLINNFKDYFIANKQPVYENPSPGNKDGGITTLEEKSLGCTQKGGASIVRGVNLYGEQVIGKGLQLVESPGNDLVSTTALTAAGAHLILFTTGRGTPFGAPVPTVKISTNTVLYNKKTNWIDFDAGRLLIDMNMEELTERVFTYIIELASEKRKTMNELNDYREIAIFKTGVTL